ncbi:hypothetical protein HELRODRAFT_149692, partial [Helobdella robusta]|uniref:BK channel n=1 Tax=Helobdella robusta TaxID=6412 RepID=T1EKD3_HELRO
IDLICNFYFLLHFVIKYVAASDKLRYWLQLTSVVDMFTIPPLLAAIHLKKHWIGIRFVCAFRLIDFSDVLQSLGIFRTTNPVKLFRLLTIFLSVCIVSAGFVFLLENSGDPFRCYSNSQYLSIWNSLYFIFITLSTVGYGDILCYTVLGRVFICIFIVGAISLFAGYIPEIIEIMSDYRTKYAVEYKREGGVRHLIVGGHISFSTVSSLMRNFTHNDRLNQNLKCVILDELEPSMELETLYKRYYNYIVFVKGSMMAIKNLKSVRLAQADVVLILTNQSAVCADTEDTKNIMKAIAVKNYFSDSRIILQLLKAENKTICKNLPFWTSSDHIICFTEMKMAFMAAGCLAPGFSTFLSNLLFMFSYSKKVAEWQNEYLKGVDMEVYTERFSAFFYGRPIHEVVDFCYTKLRLLLVAVEEDCAN